MARSRVEEGGRAGVPGPEHRRRLHGWLSILAIVAGLLGSPAARAERVVVADVYAEPDVRIPAGVLTVLLRSRLAGKGQSVATVEELSATLGQVAADRGTPLLVVPHSRIAAVATALGARRVLTGTLERAGTELRAGLRVYDGAGALLGQVAGAAPDGAIAELAGQLLSRAASLVEAAAAPPTSAALGDLRPYAAASIALAAGDLGAAGRAIQGADSHVTAPAARELAAALADNPAASFETRVVAALAAGDGRRVLALADAEIAGAGDADLAHAARALAHLDRFDTGAAEAELRAIARDRHPLVQLARAKTAQARNDSAARDRALQRALEGSAYPPALAMAASLPDGALGERGEQKVLAAASKQRDAYPGLAARVGLRAARSGADLDRSLALVDVAELGAAELDALAPLAERAAQQGLPEGYRVRAELNLRRGDTAAARSDLLQATSLAPDDARAHLQLGRVQVQQGEHAAAVESLDRAARQLPGAQRELARSLAAVGQGDRAARILGELGDPDSVELSMHEAGEMTRLGQTQQALQKLERAMDLDPDDATLMRALGQTHMQGGDKARGAELLQLADRKTGAGPAGAAAQTGGAAGAPGPAQAKARPLPLDSGALPGELVNQLARLLESFPQLKGAQVGEVVLAPLGPQGGSLFSLFRPRPSWLAAGLEVALARPPFGVASRRGADGEVHAEPLGQAQLEEIARSAGTPGVLLYRVEASGTRAEIKLVLYDTGSQQAAQLVETVDGRALGLLGWNRKLFAVLFLLVFLMAALVLVGVLRGHGEIQVKIEVDSAAEEEAYELFIRRKAARPGIADPYRHGEAVRATGFKKRRYHATMVSGFTRFDRIPPGRWYVHLVGSHDKGGQRCALEGELSRPVQVQRGRAAVVQFNLKPVAARFCITVFDGQSPVVGARVWVDEQQAQARTTGSDGAVEIDVPLGIHVLHFAAGQLAFERNVDASDGKVRTLSLNLERERRMAELTQGIALDEPEDGGIPPEIQAVMASGPPAAPAPAFSDTSDEGLQVAYLDGTQSQALSPVEMDATAAVPGLAAGSGQGGLALGTEPGAAEVAGTGLSGAALLGLRRYKPESELGRGAMGVVYRARDQVLERSVALKIMSEEIQRYPRAMEMFLQEAKALAALNHPNVVTVFDQGQDGGQMFIVMEFIEGTTLEEYLARHRRLKVQQAAAIVDQLCAGLAYAHERRIIHRDIKPANVFLSREGVAKLGDFGLARIVEEARIHRTEVRGTPLYMAPEQIRGSDIDFRADLYSVGCTFFEMLTGQPPFVEGEVLYHHLHTAPPRPSQFNAELAPAVDELVLSCIAKDQAQRIASANHLRVALRKLRQQGVL